MKQKRGNRDSGWRLGLCVLAAVLASCGGSGEGPAPGSRSGALSASQPGELLAYVKDRLRQRHALRQLEPGIEFIGNLAPPLTVSRDAGSAPVLHSGTVVQEAGVDEDDLLKTDGALIYSIATDAAAPGGAPATTLVAHRRLPDGGIETAATLALPVDPGSYPVVHGMLLAEPVRRIAVIGESITFWFGGDPCSAVADCVGAPAILPMPAVESSRVQVQAVDAASDGSLVVSTRHVLSGRLIGSRLTGTALVVVTRHAPVLAVEALPPDASDAEREAALDALVTADVLPTIQTGGSAPRPLLADTDCYLQPANASPGIEITAISVFDLAEPTAAPRSRCIVGGTEALYLSQASLVLATTRWSYSGGGDARMIYPAEISTDLHKFALDAAGPAYRGSGSVAGHLGWDGARKPYRISEHGGDLRVVTFTGESGWAVAEDAGRTPASPATLTILRERAGESLLEPVAQLPNARRPDPLGKPGEQVHAVRFLGDRAYVVTFRQIDPLYVLDLADPLDPKVAGVLEAPGFSDHLFALADGLLLGVGRDADASGVLGGVKVALFDVRDATRPVMRAERVFGVAGSSTALDASPHGMNWLAVGSTARVALPMQLVSDRGELEQGLQRIEVDTDALTLADKPLIPATGGYGPWDERSVQIGDTVYYLSAGQLGAWNW